MAEVTRVKYLSICFLKKNYRTPNTYHVIGYICHLKANAGFGKINEGKVSRNNSFNLSRRLLLQATFAASAMGFVPKTIARAQSTSAKPLTEIAPGVFVHRGHHGLVSAENFGDISNAGLIVGKDAAAVIDTSGSAKMGHHLLKVMRAVTDKPIRYVINTHMHPDHVLGNAAFKSDNTTFVAHHKMARGLRAREQGYLTGIREALGDDLFSGTEIVYPNIEVKKETTLDLGERKLILKSRPTAHTDNDLTVFDEATQTVFLGDILFAEHIPTIDGSILGWLKLIEIMKQENAARVVPGHGPVSMEWPTALDPLKAYLDVITADVRRMIEEGQTLAYASANAAKDAKTSWLLHDEYHGRNVAAAFAELEWE